MDDAVAVGRVARVVDAELVRVLAAHARLDLPDDRHDRLAAALTEVLADLDRVAGMPLGETPPATAFDARWT